MEIKQGATVPLLFPAEDSSGVPYDLTTLTEVCFLLVGAGSRVEKHAGDSGFAIVDYDGHTNNALSITLSPAETAPLRPGKIYRYWAWGRGVDGDDVIADGDAEVIHTERCL